MNILIIHFFFVAEAAICNAIMDVVSFRWEQSLFKHLGWDEHYWWPGKSWRNKYINRSPNFGLKPKWRQWFSDAWHTYKAFMLFFLFLAIACDPTIHVTYKDIPVPNFLWDLCDIALCGLVWLGTFNLFYNYILIKKS